VTQETASESHSEPQDCAQLKTAIEQTKENEQGRQQYLVKRAVELGCTEHIPDDWEIVNE
jgi:hypothetical protein